MKKQFAIIGIGRFGSSVAKTLCALGHDVLAVDRSQERIQEIADCVTHAVQADATDEETLRSLGIRNFDAVVVSIGDDIQSSILIALLCKELGVKFVIGKAQNDLHAKVLYKIGVDKVVFPERDMGVKIAHHLASTNVLDYIELASDYSLVEVTAIPEWIGKSLKQINMRVVYGLNIVAIKRGDDVLVSPKGEDVIYEGDVLVAIGRNDHIKMLEERAQE
ncbi:trk system potassium uptake protein TrkA [Caldicoprobacter guelmensis]|uniref:potassium channel family protein n=1 Tax=Caldicoprobacter guelmensis TaxID=1170224 RepID=UPI00195BC0FF|nr:TrkA family potassium uptake protein [Caldicoprobacter guelmensis]MBM7582049.1 trk system potassium uptake protein TrkA [Caldicoprobacter guelmensis]